MTVLACVLVYSSSGYLIKPNVLPLPQNKIPKQNCEDRETKHDYKYEDETQYKEDSHSALPSGRSNISNMAIYRCIAKHRNAPLSTAVREQDRGSPR